MKKPLQNIIFLVLIAFAGMISTCQKADLSEINNLNGDHISIIGHGGIGFPSPQNNLPASSHASVVKAIEGYNADGVEIDIQLSADSILFMYHDLKLESQTDCQGCIYFYNSSALTDCRFRSGFNTNIFLDEYMMPLESILERFAKRTIKPLIILDVKTSVNCQGTFEYSSFESRMIGAIDKILHKFEAFEWCIVESGNLSFLQGLKSQSPLVKISYTKLPFSESLDTALENDFYMLSFSNNSISKADIKSAQDNGLRVSLYEVKVRNAAIEAVEKSPDFIYTDNIILLQEILR